MTTPLRLLPLWLFGSFVALVILTEQIGQRTAAPLDYDIHLSARSFYFVVIGMGLAGRTSWSWWSCVLLWPVQILMLIGCTIVMIVGLAVEAGGALRPSTLEVALTLAQVVLLAAAFASLLLPAIRDAYSAALSRSRLINAACYVFLGLGVLSVALRGAGLERAAAAATVIAGQLQMQEAAPVPASADIVWDGAILDLAPTAAAAHRAAAHAFAAEAAIWHSMETLEAGIAGLAQREEAISDATSAVLLARREIGATFAAAADLEAQATRADLSPADLEEARASVEAWAAAIERAASLAASTAPLITAREIAPGNAAWGLVPTLIDVQQARTKAIGHLGRLIPQTTLERVLFRHFAAVSDALGDVTDLVPAFVDRRGASADLEATAQRIWQQTLERLSTQGSVLGLAAAFRQHETEIRDGIGVPLMEDAFVPAVANYEATGELAVAPMNAFLSLRAGLLEAVRDGKRAQAMIVPVLRSAREALTAVASQAALSETRMGVFLVAVGEAGV